MNRERFGAVVDILLEQELDLVAITGDFIVGGKTASWYVDILDGLLVELKRLSDNFPTIAVLGNHDSYTDTDASMVRKILLEANVVELGNDVFSVARDFSSLHFCGVDDVMFGAPNLENIFAKLPELGSAILLAHEPDFADISAATKRFDLQISGHSHGGQIVLFDDTIPIKPSWAKKYPSGWYEVDGMQQYTNRGLGMSHLNIRLNCRPEITIFTLMAL
ncbi:MAG: metallophosphoesterase [Anaerolineae bacterium]|nr:metallophosphoesterase [Anaerolineae bacterium]